MGDLFSFDTVREFFTPERIKVILRVGITLIVGLLFFRILSFIVSRITKKRISPQASMIVRKVIFYTGAVIVLMIVLKQLGFTLAALLGTAGIVGIAVGFAAQKSISNLISGVFLISEKPFSVNDAIKIGGTVGIVLSIDLLSTKIRSLDNQYIRIPNELILNSELTNITRFPIRRMDFNLGVAYKEDLRKVRTVLIELAEKNEFCLNEPEPLFHINKFGDSAIEILFGIWFQKDDFLALKNSMMIEIKERFDREGIEIPFPHLSLYAGSATGPIPVALSGKVMPSVPDDTGKPAKKGRTGGK